MQNLRKPCSIIHFGKNHGLYGGHFEIGHNDQLLDELSIGNLILIYSVSEPNGTAHGDFSAETNLLS